MVYIEEKVKKNMCFKYLDGKDKYVHPRGIEDVEKIHF